MQTLNRLAIDYAEPSMNTLLMYIDTSDLTSGGRDETSSEIIKKRLQTLTSKKTQRRYR